MTILIRTLAKADLKNWPERNEGKFLALSDVFDDVVDALDQGPALYFGDENGPILATGMIKENKDVACVWVIVTDNFNKNFRECIRRLPHFIRYYAKELGVKRVEAVVENDFDKAKRFAKLIGFRYSAAIGGWIFPSRASIYTFEEGI